MYFLSPSSRLHGLMSSTLFINVISAFVSSKYFTGFGIYFGMMFLPKRLFIRCIKSLNVYDSPLPTFIIGGVFISVELTIASIISSMYTKSLLCMPLPNTMGLSSLMMDCRKSVSGLAMFPL